MLRLLLTIDTERDFGENLDQLVSAMVDTLAEGENVRVQVTDETARPFMVVMDQIAWAAYGCPEILQQEELEL